MFHQKQSAGVRLFLHQFLFHREPLKMAKVELSKFVFFGWDTCESKENRINPIYCSRVESICIPTTCVTNPILAVHFVFLKQDSQAALVCVDTQSFD